jgi:DNA-binding NtrC family response regulator
MATLGNGLSGSTRASKPTDSPLHERPLAGMKTTSLRVSSIMKARILLIEEDPQIAAELQRVLRERDHAVTVALHAEDGLATAKRGSFDLVITRPFHVGPGGLEILACLRALKPTCPILVTVDFEPPESTPGVSQYTGNLVLVESLQPEEIHARIEAILDHSRLPTPTMPTHRTHRRQGPSGFLIGRSQSMQALFRDIDRISETSMPALIRGAQGTGKKLTAQTLYLRSPRTSRPMVLVHCSELSKATAVEELFGSEHPEGRPGLFERNPGGTFVLEEVGDLTLECQDRLARLLKSHCIQRVGSDTLIPIDVRVLATTASDLETAVAENSFREELYLRLCVVCLDVPSLEDRAEDIPDLVAHFLNALAEETAVPKLEIQPEAMVFLQNQRWPGNVSQLEQVLRQSAINSKPSTIIALDHVLKAVILNQG